MTPRQLIDTIPALAGVHSIEPLSGGQTNRSFLLEDKQGRWVLRLNQAAPGVDRRREAAVLAAIAEHDLGPRVLACDLEQGYLLTEYLELPVWSTAAVSDEGHLRHLGGFLRRLHGLDIEVPPVDVIATLSQYIEQLEDKEPRLAELLTRGKSELEPALADCGYFERQPALCHLDPSAGNIFGREHLRMIDWEFAGASHPLLDIAFFIHYHDLTPDTYAALVEAYFGAFLPELREQLGAHLQLVQWLELAWLSLQQQQGQLTTAGEQRLRRLMIVLA